MSKSKNYMTQRNDIIAGTCHNDIKTKTVIVLKKDKVRTLQK